ncbi:MAG: hypothetical protein IIB87_05330 [Chloroflexi bacterium]|nr:hypothetical protein [Chloroflexota bacterium]
MLFVRIIRGVAAIALIALIATALLWPQLSGTARADNTGFQSPTDIHAPNEWVTPERAFESGVATSAALFDKQGYSEFDFSVPGGAFILGIAVQVDAKALDSSGCDLEVALSWNDGSSSTSTQTADLTDSFAIHTVGGSNDTWGRDWASSEFDHANFLTALPGCP